MPAHAGVAARQVKGLTVGSGRAGLGATIDPGR
jgi:hypothetical protein